MYPYVIIKFYGRGNKPRRIGFMTERDAINYQYYINDWYAKLDNPVKRIKAIERHDANEVMREGIYPEA